MRTQVIEKTESRTDVAQEGSRFRQRWIGPIEGWPQTTALVWANEKPPPARRREGVRWEWPGRPGRPAGSEIVAQRLTVTLACSLFTYLKNTGKATKKATQIRYSTPLMWE